MGVLVAGLGGVRHFGRRRERFEGEGTDPHAGVQRDREDADVAELERRVANPAGIEHAGGAVDDDAEAAEAAAAFEAGEQIGRELERLDRHSEHQLARMERKGFVRPDLDLAHDLVHVDALPQIDEREAAVLEDAELRAETEVHRAASELVSRSSAGVTRIFPDSRCFLMSRSERTKENPGRMLR